MPTLKTPTRWPFPDAYVDVEGVGRIRCRLNAHTGSGQWRKTHNHRDYYFGTLSDPEGALTAWRQEWPRIVKGEPARKTVALSSLSLQMATYDFLLSKKDAMNRGELEWETFREYRELCKYICDTLSRSRELSSLGPDDFRKLLRGKSHLSPIKRRNFVIKTRTVINTAAKRAKTVIDFGDDFRTPPMKLIRLQRADRRGRLWTPGDFFKLIEKADDWMAALCWVAINCGANPKDAGRIQSPHLKLWPDADGPRPLAWLDTTRGKTGADRRVPLWPETLDALLKVYDPTKPLLFTGPRGGRLHYKGNTQVSRWFKTLATRACVPGKFSWFRYTFSTVASQTGDDHARDIIMGHVVDGVPENYVLDFPETRLLRVSLHVRDWLLRG